MNFFKRTKSPEIISLHIPKTAGTSFRNILKSVYGDKNVVRFDINNNGVVRLNEEIYSAKQLPPSKVIHGHFHYEILTSVFQLPEHYKFITWVRDPVKRVLSNFYYLESRLKEILNEDKKNLNILSKMQRSLIEYARVDINRNRQSKFLKGKPLETFDFIGIQENFHEEVTRLSQVLGWKSIPEVLFHNKTEGRPIELPTEILEEIRELNMEDLELYREALRIRDNKFSV
ncbi:MAG TPA: sulfotransferase family 2 domain-containing protein [Bacteroidia bacterium]|nr:sulfotransferase family 2 domain-containing protein [Bacteroidia bacterium]